jgi:hypothetical protein
MQSEMQSSAICSDVSASTAKEKEFLKMVIPDEAWDALVGHDAILAGGAITSIFSGRCINDFDIYSRSQSTHDSLVSKFSKCMSDKYKSEMSHSFICGKMEKEEAEHYGIEFDISDHPFQLVFPSVACGSVDSILNTFDFTCVQAAFSFKKETFYFHRNFLKDLAKRDLIYNLHRNHELSTTFRVEKYIKKGFFISNFERMKIVVAQNPSFVNTYADFVKELRKITRDPSMSVVHRYLHTYLYGDCVEAKTAERLAGKFDIIDFCEKVEDFCILMGTGEQRQFDWQRDEEDISLGQFYDEREKAEKISQMGNF